MEIGSVDGGGAGGRAARSKSCYHLFGERARKAIEARDQAIVRMKAECIARHLAMEAADKARIAARAYLSPSRSEESDSGSDSDTESEAKGIWNSTVSETALAARSHDDGEDESPIERRQAPQCAPFRGTEFIPGRMRKIGGRLMEGQYKEGESTEEEGADEEMENRDEMREVAASHARNPNEVRTQGEGEEQSGEEVNERNTGPEGEIEEHINMAKPKARPAGIAAKGVTPARASTSAEAQIRKRLSAVAASRHQSRSAATRSG